MGGTPTPKKYETRVSGCGWGRVRRSCVPGVASFRGRARGRRVVVGSESCLSHLVTEICACCSM
eukprot:3090270-Prymnesium_polylepis.1